MSFRIRVVLWIPVFAILVIGCVLYFAEFLGFPLPLSYTDRTIILLTSALTMFAAIEGYSTYMQVELENRKNKIEDARNELEKAYGPLLTMLNKFDKLGDGEGFWLTVDEINQLNRIMATYPFMFPSEIYDLWRVKIPSALAVQSFKIPLEFRDKINKEYVRRFKEYKELLKK